MSEVSEGGREMDAGFRYVLEVYANVSRLLLACDAILQPHKFAPYAWAPMEPPRKADAPKTWLPNRAVRQYYPQDRQWKEILTVGAYLYSRHDDKAFEPVCVASMMAVNTANTDAVYWLGVLGALSRAPRGVVETVRATDGQFAWGRSDFEKVVRDGVILSIAVPLLEITSTTQVEDRLLTPLFQRLETQPQGGFVMPGPGAPPTRLIK